MPHVVVTVPADACGQRRIRSRTRKLFGSLRSVGCGLRNWAIALPESVGGASRLPFHPFPLHAFVFERQRVIARVRFLVFLACPPLFPLTSPDLRLCPKDTDPPVLRPSQLFLLSQDGFELRFCFFSPPSIPSQFLVSCSRSGSRGSLRSAQG